MESGVGGRRVAQGGQWVQLHRSKDLPCYSAATIDDSAGGSISKTWKKDFGSFHSKQMANV